LCTNRQTIAAGRTMVTCKHCIEALQTSRNIPMLEVAIPINGSWTQQFKCSVWGSHGRNHKEHCLLGWCHVVRTNFLKFRRNVLPPSSMSKLGQARNQSLRLLPSGCLLRLLFEPWRSSQYVLLKFHCTSIRIHNTTPQTTAPFS
jgi:hypothetical protein